MTMQYHSCYRFKFTDGLQSICSCSKRFSNRIWRNCVQSWNYSCFPIEHATGAHGIARRKLV